VRAATTSRASSCWRREGINSTIAGAPDDVHAVLAYLRQDPLLADLQHKESWAERPPFHRMKVRLKRKSSPWACLEPTRP
jgi:predicted sulfurtransferase